MRELKFRVYIPDHEKFCYFTLGNFDYSDRYLHQHSYPVQQYTGLKDKNGKEIYEGDIVSYEAGEPNRNDGSFYKSISEVKFENGAFWPRPMKEECEDSWYDYELKNICIIGNIFENPELLGAKQLLR